MKRIQQLDGVRGIAILAVFVHHAIGVKLMWMGVDLFFILSGFLITGVLQHARGQSLRGFFGYFYERRARRILAPYLLLLFLGSMVLGVGWIRHWYFYLLLTNFLLPLGIPHPSAFVPLWSLAVEEQFYLVWPFAVYFLDERQLKWLCGILIITAPVLRGTLHFQQHWPIYTLTPFRMDLLAAGAMLRLEWNRNRNIVERWGLKASVVLVAAGLATLATLGRFNVTTYGNTRVGNALIYEGALFICLGFMLYALSGRSIRWLQFSALRYIGTISYSMYLVHLGALELVGRHVAGGAKVIVAFSLTVLYATLSWHLIERPLLRGVKSARVPALETS